MRVGFRAARGAPGTTTLALAVAAEMNAQTGDTLVVEADPHGGTLAALLGLAATPSVIEFGTDGRPATENTLDAETTHDLGEGLRLLTAPCSAIQAATAWTAARVRFEAVTRAMSANVVIDRGRQPSDGDGNDGEDRQVWVARPTLPELASLIAALRDGDDTDPELRFVAVVQLPPSTGHGLHPREVREVIAPFGRLVEIPWDPRAVAALHSSPTRLTWRRSRFGTAVGSFAAELLSLAVPPQLQEDPSPPDRVEVLSP
jgi:MinD-like ATPase involved in chromosome partitioning or flagellar assembly